MNATCIQGIALTTAFYVALLIRGTCAGDTGIYLNEIYVPPRLPEWGQEHPENKPTKYNIGDMGHEIVNGKLIFFIIKEIRWNPITHEPEYIKSPACGLKA